MSGLSHGLNLPKKRDGGLQRVLPPKRKTIFDDDPEEDEDEDDSKGGAQEIESFTGLKLTSKGGSGENSKTDSQSKPPARPAQASHGVTDLSARLSAAKHTASAQEVDPNIYDYDAAYDSMHKVPTKKKKSTAPQYMQSLLDSAEVRKRDQLRAKEKLLAREREAEGEEFADKETFVTEAYKAQQKELQRLEEEEKKREEAAEERSRREGGGMKGFYRTMLDRADERHKAIAEGAKQDGEQEDEEPDKEKEQAELAASKGAVVNEDGQVVDKRQLLSGGLNVVAKPAPTKDKRKGAKLTESASMNILSGRMGAKAAMRERQTRLLEEQLEQSAKRAAEDEAAEEDSLKKAAKSRKTEGDVSSARERYLQRKREAEAAKAAGKGT